jgi:hypothetical protein
VHKLGQQRLTSRWRCQKIIIAAVIAYLIDGIAQIFANPEAFAYRLFEPPRRRALQGTSIPWTD